MKYGIILGILLLIVTVQVQAASCDRINDICDTEFFSKSYNSQETFEYDNVIYSSVFYSEQRVVLYADNQKYIIPGECECRRSDDGKTLYCIDDIETVEEDIDDGKLDHVKFVNGESREYIEFIFCKAKPSIDVDYEISKDDPNLNDVVSIEVAIENKGTKAAQEATLSIPVPEGLVVAEHEDFEYDGKVLTLDLGTFSPSSKQNYKIVLRVKNSATYEIEPLLTYTYEQEDIEKKDSFRIKVKSPYEVGMVVPTSISIDEPFWLDIKVDNKMEDDQIRIDEFTFSLPEGISIYEDNAYTIEDWQTKAENKKFLFETKDDRTFTYKGQVTSDGTIEYKLRLVSHTEGNHVIGAKYKIVAKGETYEETKNVEAKIKGFKLPEFSFSVTNEVVGGNEYWIRATVENKDSHVDFKNLKLSIISDITKKIDIEKANLPHETQITLFQDYYKSHEVLEKEQQEFKLTGYYYDDDGNQYEVDDEELLNIIPPKANLTITIVPSKTKVVPGEEISIGVKIKNNEDVYVGTIKGSDEVPPELEITGGRMAATISLEKNEEKQIYQYKIKIPENFDEQTITVLTNVISQIGSVTFSNEESIDIEVDVDAASINTDDNNIADNQTTTNITDNGTGENTEHQGLLNKNKEGQEKGFLTRVFEGIGKFISSIFD